MKFKDIQSPLEFGDISDEGYREYVYKDGFRYRIEDPIGLNVSKSGGHKIVTSAGRSIYVLGGWIAFEYPGTEGRNHWEF